MFAIYSKGAATLILRGKPYTLSSDHPRYADLVTAINDKNEDDALAIVTAHDTLAEVLGVFGDISVFCGHVSYKGRHLPANYLAQQILAFQKDGRDVEPLARFLDQAMANPDPRAAADLYRWCEVGQMPISSDGRIIAYKIVNNDFTDSYTGNFDNSPGAIVTQDRAECDPDPTVTCSRGLHFCSASYLPHYGPSNKRVVLVAVSPTDVVAFPTDYNLSKARCCKYEVLHEIDADTAASFFAHSPLVYDGPEPEVDVDFSEDKAFAEARGYQVLLDDDNDWDWEDREARRASGYFDTEAEAWADAAQDARDLGVEPVNGEASVTTTASAVADHFAVTTTMGVGGSMEVPFWASAVENHPATRDPLAMRLDRLITYLGLPLSSKLDDVELNLGLSCDVHQSVEHRYAACERIVGFPQ